MASQNLWIGITIGIFFAGLAIGYALFSGPAYPGNMMMNNQQTMMTNSQMQQMMANSEFMEQMMHDPDFQRQMFGTMKYNDEFMHEMMQDYDNREHMMGHLVEDHDLLENMGLESMMQSGNMGQGMMGMMNPEIMNQIMEDPQKREQMMSMMKEHVADMDELLSSNLSDQEFSEKMLQLMHQHMSEMQGLTQMP